MNTQIEIPSAPPAQGESEPFTIFLRVCIPPELLPMGYSIASFTWIPMLCLGEALAKELQTCGLAAAVNACGSLHLGIVTIRVMDAAAALPHVKALLARVNLDPFTSIHWFDHREGIFRTVHVGIADLSAPHFTMDRMKADQDKLRAENESSCRVSQAIMERFFKQPPASPENAS